MAIYIPRLTLSVGHILVLSYPIIDHLMFVFYTWPCFIFLCVVHLSVLCICLPLSFQDLHVYVALKLDKIKSAWSQITGFVYKPFYGAWQQVLIEARKGKWLAKCIMQQIFWRCQRIAVPTTVSNHFVKGGHTKFHRYPHEPECRTQRQWILPGMRRDWAPAKHATTILSRIILT